MFELMLNNLSSPTRDGWDMLPPGRIPLNYQLPATAAIDDEIFFIGGYTTVNLNLFIKYNTVTKVWTSLPNLNPAYRLARAAAVGTRIYVTGGYSTAYDSTWRCFDTTTGQWIVLASNGNNSSQAPSVAAIGDTLYVIGGISSGRLNRYDIATNVWTVCAACPVTLYSPSGNGLLTVVNGKLYAMFGTIATNNFNKAPYEYNPATNTWLKKTVSTGAARASCTAVVIQDKIYCQTPGIKYFDVYDPSLDTWEYNVSPLRYSMNSIVANNDKIWLAGSSNADNLFASVDPFVST